MIEILSVVLNAVLGGGLIVSLVTLRSVRRKAAAESKKAELENAEQAARIVMESIAEPIRKELKHVSSELSRFRRAVEKGYTCKYHIDCPILSELQREEAGNYRGYDEGRGIRDYPRHDRDGSS